MRIDYKTLYPHTARHDIKRWLLDAASDDDAWTIYRAVERMSGSRLARRLARMLTQDEER
jgi:hypothetical protein